MIVRDFFGMAYVMRFAEGSNTYSNFVGESRGSIPKDYLNQNGEKKRM
jgi:hypothetical protein